MFRLAHISENLGYGLRKLKRWQEVTGRPMRIETTINSVKVTFDLHMRNADKADVAKNDAKNISQRQRKILEIIQNNPAISLDSIAKAIGVSSPTIDREVSKMVHLIRRVGPKKGGHWQIID